MWVSHAAVSVAGKFFDNGFDIGDKLPVISGFVLWFMIIRAVGQVHKFAPPFRVFEEVAMFSNETSLFFGSVKRPR